MATTVHKITLSSSRDIPFNKLVLSQSNAWRVKAGVSIEKLADDIARRTLLQGLSARPVLDAEGAETGMFEVPAGGGRYRALQHLVKQKRLSKSDKLIEDAKRDWSALGMERPLVTPLSRFRQGTPIRLLEGVLFTTYATLRIDERGEKLSRVRQIVEWLGSNFDGVIIFDESHAMQNAAAHVRVHRCERHQRARESAGALSGRARR
jgi:NTP hydrolase family protein